VAYPRIANTPATLTDRRWAAIHEDLCRNPGDEGAWTQLAQWHSELLSQTEGDLAAELVVRGCRLMGDAHVQQVAAPHVEDLLREQWTKYPRVFEHTVARLRQMPVSAGRQAWLQIVRRVRERQPLTSHEASGAAARPHAARDVLPCSSEPPFQEEPGGPALRPLAAAATALEEELGAIPSMALARSCPAAQEKLEVLDDLVFESIAGNKEALARFSSLWPRVVAELGPDLLEESKQRYLEHAMEVWRHCLEGDAQADPALGLTALEVISIVFGTGTPLPSA
jgi:hypothetical protein